MQFSLFIMKNAVDFMNKKHTVVYITPAPKLLGKLDHPLGVFKAHNLAIGK